MTDDNLPAQLAALINPARGTGRLEEAATRGAIGVSVTEAQPATPSGTGALVSPLTEQAYAGATWYSLVSSDGLFVFEYPDETEYRDAVNTSIVVQHLAP